jgi:anti-sigma regulatory factor (Ser/Thr protein kinase)
MVTLLATIELSGGPAAVAAARHAIEALAHESQLPRLADLRLLVSELVTNSVLHGGAGPEERVRLRVERPNRFVRVEVWDDGPGWGERVGATALESAERPGGWGLVLVGALADRWGLERGRSTCVWFELDAA